jgi:hypothetical protein
VKSASQRAETAASSEGTVDPTIGHGDPGDEPLCERWVPGDEAEPKAVIDHRIIMYLPLARFSDPTSIPETTVVQRSLLRS